MEMLDTIWIVLAKENVAHLFTATFSQTYNSIKRLDKPKKNLYGLDSEKFSKEIANWLEEICDSNIFHYFILVTPTKNFYDLLIKYFSDELKTWAQKNHTFKDFYGKNENELKTEVYNILHPNTPL